MKFHLQGSLFGAALCAVAVLAGTASAATLDRIRDSGSIKLGYRQDAAPFSYADSAGLPAGYSVALCQAVAQMASSALKQDLKIEYVPVTTESRFSDLQAGRIDLLCGATTMTLERRKLVDFSLLTFVTGSSVLYRRNGPANFLDLAGEKVGVRAGTTTDDGLKRALAENGIAATVVGVTDHEEGRSKLESGEIAAYFADREILAMLGRGSQHPENLILSDRFFSYEPYALALQRGDDDFRLLVDTTLARLYRSKALGNIYQTNFGNAGMSDLLKAIFTLQALPE